MARGETLARHFDLLFELASHRLGICTDDLAQALECTKRTVLRDLQALRDHGFPISPEARDYGKRFWRVEPWLGRC